MADVDRPGEGHDFRTLVRQFELNLIAASTSTLKAANEANYAGTIHGELFEVCRDGERTERLTRLAGYFIGKGIDVRNATAFCLAWNARNEPPLPDEKVINTVASIARTHARNHPSDEVAGTPLFDLQDASVGRFFDRDPPDRDWVLQDCIPLGKTGLLVAPGGTGKSQFVLQLAIDIAIGQKRFSPWVPGKAGQVVIIGAEDDDDEFHRRFRRLTDGGTALRDASDVFAALKSNLYIVSRVGVDNLMTISQQGEVVQTDYVERLALTLKPLENLRLIVIDPVARFRGGDENFAADATRFVEAAERLANLTGAAVLLVHHVNKGSMNVIEQNQGAARGSSALSDGVRVQINLAPISAEEKHRIGLGADERGLVAKITKTNYSTAGDPIFLRRDEQGRLLPITASETRGSRKDVQIAMLLDILSEEASRGRQYSKSTFAQAYGGRERQFGIGIGALKELIDDAIDAGLLEPAEGKQRALRVRAAPLVRATPLSS